MFYHFKYSNATRRKQLEGFYEICYVANSEKNK